jgi:hypothetical protein
LINLRTISVKTQVRRLRYFQVLMRTLESKGYPKEVLARKLITWSGESHSHFQKYSSPSGEIVPSKKGLGSQSFENYYIAAKNLGLLIEQNGFVIPTRTGEVLGKFNEIDSGLKDLLNVYELTMMEKFYFPYLLLTKDFDIVVTLLNMLAKGYSELPKFYADYKAEYLRRLEEKMEFVPLQEKSQLFDAYQRVQGWKNPKRYSEDIIPSRLNWLIDLGLIDSSRFQKEEKYFFSESGLRFWRGLPIYSSEGYKDVTSHWLKSAYFGFVSSCFAGQNRDWRLLKPIEKHKLISEAVANFLIRFNTFGIPRLSVEQTCLFISLFSLTERQIIVEANEIVEWIGFEKELDNLKLGYRGASRPGESYIIVSNA